MQNNRSTGTTTPMRLALYILAIVLLVGVVVASIYYFVIFKQPSGTSSSQVTPTIGTTSGGGGPCTINSPYGFTTINADSQLVSVYKQLNVCWVRYQFNWWNKNKKGGIQSAPNVYDWSKVDAAVATMNAAKIHIDFVIQAPPDWTWTQSCNGKLFLPGPDQMSAFASLLATRYNGHNGHGFIDDFEIGNEEYDNYYVAGDSSSLLCRNASYYGPVLEAGYKAIKKASPNATVGMFGMWYHNLPHIQDFMTYLYANGYGPYMDYMNFHYYHSGEDPSVTDGSNPSFDLWWQTMHDIAAHYGFANKPIWVTETGWPTTFGYAVQNVVTPQVQAQYMQYVLSEAAKSHVVQKVFWFTINYGHQSDSIYPNTGTGPLPAFYTLQTMIRQKPHWNS